MTVTQVPAADRRRGGPAPRRRPTGYGAYLDGANALQIGYGEADHDPVAPAHQPAGRPDRQPTDRPERGPAPAVAPGPLAPPPPLPVALPRASFLVLLVGLVVAGVIGVLVINTKINENAFRLDDLRAHQAALDLQEQQLSQQLAERESPGNLAAAANRLGLVPAGTPAFISLPDGRVVGVPQPATGQSGLAAAVADPGR